MADQLLQRISKILPAIRANIPSAERERSLPAENIELLRQAGLFRALQPKEFGGEELPVTEYGEVLVTLAETCTATGWACGLLANHAHFVAHYAEEAQHEVWGSNPDARIASSVAPAGKAEFVAGGIRLSGRFGYSSGCDHAQWAVLGYIGKNPMGQPGPCFALVPKQDFEIIDDWDTAGMRGTGSKTLVVDGQFVPDHRLESLFALNMGMSRGFGNHAGAIYQLPFQPVFSLAFAATAVGVARNFHAVFVEKIKARIRAYTGAKSVDDSVNHMRVGESANQITTAHELLRRDWREMMSFAEQQSLPSPETLLLWRAHQAYAAKLCVQAVDRLMEGAGGSAWFHESDLQRLFRDIHALSAHANLDYATAAQTLGRLQLGLSLDGKFF